MLCLIWQQAVYIETFQGEQNASHAGTFQDEQMQQTCFALRTLRLCDFVTAATLGGTPGLFSELRVWLLKL